MPASRRAISGLTLCGFLLSLAALGAEEPRWRDATRDIFIDGRLDRQAQALVAGHRTAVVSSLLDDAYLLDRDTGSLWTVPRAAFRIAEDRATALLDPGAALEPSGSFQKVDPSSQIFAGKGHTVLIARHQGLVGEVTEEALFAAVPVWKSLAQGYTPAPGAVAALRKVTKPTSFSVVFGTWCGDSKEYVPRLLKALREAANPKLSARLVALDNQFLEPAEVIRARRIINVPTMIVERHGGELGRVTETPATATVEEDLSAILEGRPREHRGRYEREAELARGTYLYRGHCVKESLARTFDLRLEPLPLPAETS